MPHTDAERVFLSCFGARLRRQRWARGLRLSDLGAAIGLAPVQIGRWERALAQPTAQQWVAVAVALQIAPVTLLDSSATRALIDEAWTRSGMAAPS